MNTATANLNILLVEDSLADARLIQILLEEAQAPVSIEHVESMQAAVRAIADRRFDITLLDLGLPDGFGLDNIIRINTLAPELPIMIMTGLDDSQTAEAARNLGAKGYLVKGSIEDGAELLKHLQAATAGTADEQQAEASVVAVSSGIETDLSGIITAWNEEASQITGFSKEEILGHSISDLIPANRQDEIALIGGRIQRGQSLREFETVRLHRDGSEREVNLTVLPLTNAEGAIVGTRTLIRDITELKRDRADAMQLAAIVASTDDAIISTTLDGIITHWNPGAQANLGYSSAEMLGAALIDIVPDAFKDRAEAMILAARRGRTVPRFDGQLVHKLGHLVDFSISLSPIRDHAGGLMGAAILAGDITERKRAEAALEQEIDEHEAANKTLRETVTRLREAQDQLVQAEKLASLGGLVAGVAHEINTPVGVGVTAASHLRRKLEELREAMTAGSLKRSQLDDFVTHADQATRIILTNSKRASELIQSFKQVAVDQSSSEKRRFHLKQYLNEILLSLRPKLKPTGIDVQIECDEELVIESLPGAYSQIFTNLVINSLTHAYGPGDQGIIRIVATLEGKELKIEYVDDGLGMTPEVKAHVFDPFFTTKRGQGGSGLGMHILYNLITQKLGGSLQLSSSPGEGMSLNIVLPQA